MNFTIAAALVFFLALVYLDAKRKTARHRRLIAEEKSSIASASRMTAKIGVFYPDIETTVVMGASEDYGACYYRVLRQGKVIHRSKINLANIVRVELLVNSQVRAFDITSEQPTSALRATEVAGKTMSRFTPEELKILQRAGLRIIFLNEEEAEKSLEITVLRMGDERHSFKRMELLKNAVWWAEYLNLVARKARMQRACLTEEDGAELQPG